MSGRRFVCDIESTPIRFPFVERIHCAVLIDIDTEEARGFRMHVPEERRAFLEDYAAAELIVGHKFISFDHIQIAHHLGVTKRRDQVIDTLPLGRLIWSDVKNWGPNGKGGDWALWAPMKAWKAAGSKGPPPECFPGNQIGNHGLEAWGHRTGDALKGDYSKDMELEAKAKGLKTKAEILEYTWGTFNERMFDYMIQDGRVNLAVFKRFMAELEGRTDPHTGLPIPWRQSVELTMRLQWICAKIERNGWFFNVQKAQALYGELAQRRHEIEVKLKDLFPTWREKGELFTPKVTRPDLGYVAGVPFQKWKTVEFNPKSRQHVYKKLIETRGWEPAEFNEDKTDPETGETVEPGKPKVNDQILKDLARTKGWEECSLLAEFYMIQKRIGALAEGAQAWLKKVDEDGRIRSTYNINATPGGRATHASINITQVPSIANADGIVPYGRECRELFYTPETIKGRRWVQMGADQDGLELRCLGNFLIGFDNGAYLEDVVRGDIHWANAKAIFGLVEDLARNDDIKDHKTWRGIAKRVIYAMIYGGGDYMLGSIVGYTREEAQGWLKDPHHRAALKTLKRNEIGKAKRFREKTPSDDKVFTTYKGLLVRQRLMERFPALAKLIKVVQDAAKRGWILGLDGRVLPIRSPHSALNTLLQSAGYVVCAQWLIEIEDACDAAGLKEGWDGDYVWIGFIHDEAAFSVREDKKEILKAIVENAGKLPSQPFPQWRAETVAGAVFGPNWAATH